MGDAGRCYGEMREAWGGEIDSDTACLGGWMRRLLGLWLVSAIGEGMRGGDARGKQSRGESCAAPPLRCREPARSSAVHSGHDSGYDFDAVHDQRHLLAAREARGLADILPLPSAQAPTVRLGPPSRR